MYEFPVIISIKTVKIIHKFQKINFKKAKENIYTA